MDYIFNFWVFGTLLVVSVAVWIPVSLRLYKANKGKRDYYGREFGRSDSFLHAYWRVFPPFMVYVVVAILVGIGSAMARSDHYQYDDYKTRDFPLKQMVMGTKDTSDAWYFLIAGGGEKGSEQRFYYYVESPDHTVKMYDNNVKNINFAEDIKPGDVPRVTCMLSHSEWDDKGVDARFGNDGNWVDSECIFHIPEHSIGTKIDTKIRVK